MKNLLFISHYFPPLGGAGVQRPLKFVKYLPEHGFYPTVITGSGQPRGRWSPEDESLLDEVPNGIKVYRALSGAARGFSDRPRLEELVDISESAARDCAPEAIFVSMTPFTDCVVASSLSRKLKIPWVADLRDPWALDEFQVYRTGLHRVLTRWKMSRSLQTASLIIMNTPEAAARFRQAFPLLRRRTKVVSITNGWDAEDFASPLKKSAGPFTIVHSGYLHADAGDHQRRNAVQYRMLGRVERGVELICRSHYYLLQALEKWRSEDPGVGERARLVLAGVPTDLDRNLVNQSPVAGMAKFTGYLSHSECLEQVRNADLLFLPMHKMPPSRRATIVPGKTYEYMAAGLPILAPVPPGDARDFLTNAGTGLLCEPDDVPAMARILKEQFRAWQAGEKTIRWNKCYVDQFERRQLTGRLAEELNELLGAPLAKPVEAFDE
jgi:glycosyltransferase involved in cell wall biosynthesis